jgi:hypothetical protein
MDTNNNSENNKEKPAINSWQHLEHNERITILTLVAAEIGTIENAIEKDWWVSIVLKALFQTTCSKHLTFKGGTSLSKGWDLIQRFSEDIDLALDRSFFGDEPKNNNQRKILRKKTHKYINETLVPELDVELKKIGVDDYSISIEEGADSDKDPTVVFVNYTSILPNQNEYVSPVVKIEISCLTMSEPSEPREMSSLILDYYPKEDSINSCNVETVIPTRTFLEKIFLLHEELSRDIPRHLRMSRHLYDLEKLMDTEYGKKALEDPELYKQIVNHRAVNYHLGYVDYGNHHPSTIEFIPSKENQVRWNADYNDMVTNFIYGDSLPFQELIKRMEELKERIRNIEIENLTM